MSAYGDIKRVLTTSVLPSTVWAPFSPLVDGNTEPDRSISVHHLTLATASALPGLLEYLGAVFAKEIDDGLTYPQEGEMEQKTFEAYFFAADVFVGIVLSIFVHLTQCFASKRTTYDQCSSRPSGSNTVTANTVADIAAETRISVTIPGPTVFSGDFTVVIRCTVQVLGVGCTTIVGQSSPRTTTPLGERVRSGDQVTLDIDAARGQRTWEECVAGYYYIKPNYPGRSSHICNAGFVVPPVQRKKGYGSLLSQSYVHYAPRLGYQASVFNLVYVNNVASVRLWEKLGFTKAGRIPRAGRLRTADGLGEEYVDAWLIYKSFVEQ